MRLHRWRYGILALAVFLALPIMAEASVVCGDETIEDTKTQICLRWFDLENGEGINKAFTIPTACEGDLKCFLGDTELTECETVTSEEVSFDAEKGRFYMKDFPTAEAYCFSDEAQKKPIYIDSDPKYCKLIDSSLIEKRWNPPFLPYTEGKKADPWNEGKSYCPDPLLSGHSAAYDAAPGAHIDTTPEIVRRRALDACITVVTKYRDACEAARSELSGQVGTKAGDKKKEIDEKKREKIAEWVTAEDCIGEKMGDNCRDEWNIINGYTVGQLALGSDNKFLTPPENLKNEALKDYIIGKIQANNALEDQDNKKWKSGSLEAFLTAQAESEVDVSVINGEITDINDKIGKVGSVISFLQKRISTLSLSNALSETKTFNVTDRLRRRSGENGSTESELTLFQKDDDGTPRNIFDKVIRLVAQVLGSLGVLLLIVSAVMMIVSQGEETMLQKAKQTFLYTLIGLAIAFFSYTIVRFLLELLLTR